MRATLPAAAVLLVLAGPLAARGGETTRVSVDLAGGDGDGSSAFPALSASGRIVAFDSEASDLVAGDGNAESDIFVRDRKTGETTRVSVDSAGAESLGRSRHPALSASGRIVAFRSTGDDLVAGDGNGVLDIFVHDRKTGETTRVSVDSAGQEGNGDSFDPAVSANGRFVAFGSSASNLVGGDGNGMDDVFVHDRKTGETTRVSVGSAGVEGDGASGEPVLSANGRFVAFFSDATNLVAGDGNGVADVFVHDRKTGETTRVSVDSNGVEGDASSGQPALSANGRVVVFRSSASNLVAGDGNNQGDIFVHDRKTGETTRVSVASAGQESHGDCVDPAVSANGRLVAFESSADDLVPADGNGVQDVFLHDRKKAETSRVSVTSAGAEGDGISDSPALSRSGRSVAFASDATDLVTGDGNGFGDVFVQDVR